MTSASPTLYRTLFRRAALQSTRGSTQCLAVSSRTFAQSSIASSKNSPNTSNLPDDEHTLSKNKKGDRLDVQTENANKGIDAQKKGTGGSATEGKDSAGGVAKAKKEFPNAPDPAIGMQDERGGRGG